MGRRPPIVPRKRARVAGLRWRAPGGGAPGHRVPRSTVPSGTRKSGARQGRVVGLGLCCVDHLYRVESLDLASQRIRYQERSVSLGGMTANALVQASAEGAHTEALSTVGDDPEARVVRRALRRAGVGTRGVRRVVGGATRLAVVLVDAKSGERRFIVVDREPYNRAAPDLPLGAIQPGSVLLTDGHYERQLPRALERARKVGATVVADWNRPLPALLDLLPLVDHPVVPVEFAELYSGGDTREALRRLRRVARGEPVVTLGARGALYFEGGRIRRHPAPRVRVVDSTGAGDAFHGAFAAALSQGADLLAAIERGTRAGARCCEARGATGHLFPVEERVVDARWERTPAS